MWNPSKNFLPVFVCILYFYQNKGFGKNMNFIDPSLFMMHHAQCGVSLFTAFPIEKYIINYDC